MLRDMMEVCVAVADNADCAELSATERFMTEESWVMASGGSYAGRTSPDFIA
jgi:hypothetical protein